MGVPLTPLRRAAALQLMRDVRRHYALFLEDISVRYSAHIAGLAISVVACGSSPSSTTASSPSRVSLPLASNDSTTVSVDTAGFQRRADTISLWIRYDLTRPAPYPDSAGTKVFRMEVLADVDCVGRQAQDVTLRIYDLAGGLIREEPLHTPGWQDFSVASQGTAVHTAVCGILAKTSTKP